MRNKAARRCVFGLLGAGCVAFAAPVQAQTLEDLDRLSDLSATEQGGIAAARDLAGGGDLLEAIATLERVMAANPRSVDARILHAFYLCAIDDLQGARVELDVMEDDDIDPQALAEVRNRCPGASREFVPRTTRRQPAPPPAAPAELQSPGAVPSQDGNRQGSREATPTASGSTSGSASGGQNSSRERPTPPPGGGEKD